MKRGILYFLISLIVNINISYCQGKLDFQITGQLKSESTMIYGVTVVASNTYDTSIKYYGISDSVGNFSIKVTTQGVYKILAETQTNVFDFPKLIKVDNNGCLNIGSSKALIKTEELNSVTVIGERSLIKRKSDRIIFNPQGNSNLQSLTADELLNRIPFTVMNALGEISIRGISGAQIQINGKPYKLSSEQLISYLKSIPVSNIEDVEVITTPSSKFDAEGNAGIININLKKEKSLGTIYTLKVNFDQTRLSKFGFFGDITYRSKASYLQVNLNSSTGKYYRGELLENNYRLSDNNIFWKQKMDRTRLKSDNNYSVVYEYSFIPKFSVGISVTGSFFYDDMLLTSHSDISKCNNSIDSSMHTTNQVLTTNQTHSTNAFAKKLIGKRNDELSFDIDYTYFQERQDTRTKTDFIDGHSFMIYDSNDFASFTPRKINIISGKLDYVMKLSTQSSFSFGSKLSTIETNNDVRYINYEKVASIGIVDTIRSNIFSYKESNVAVYSNYWRAYSSGIEFQVGLRSESFRYKGEEKNLRIENQYFKIFPSFSFSIPQNDFVYKASYSYRINRPTFSDLNPFRFYTNPYIYAEGNPLLMPSFSHNLEISTSIKRAFSVMLFGVFTSDLFIQIPKLDDTNQTFIYNKLNMDNDNTLGLSFYYNKGITKFWNIATSNSIFNHSINSNVYNTRLKKQLTSYQIQLVNSFKIQKLNNLSCEISLNYLSSTFKGLYNLDRTYNIDVSLSQLVLKNRVSLSLNFLDITNGKIYKTQTDFENMNTNFIQNFDLRTIRLSMLYKFGKTTVESGKNKKGSNTDELNRL
ncbi:MAG: outer membrane beta-barrel family protein [Flavobacterium nitrogenifigens]|uniref:outer membrane beta-barrel family protein n=1 Tax=Flavobacterium nitrogenifigens TaxID=1617283 RepID=UPI0028074B13|nr:outer membrane beta-barrel family protein [Flavobacterium nitrogenifigens]MDQ8012683.1 outer membrane beta-barrel family protein [Flavobacterium nitrogenifigens]